MVDTPWLILIFVRHVKPEVLVVPSPHMAKKKWWSREVTSNITDLMILLAGEPRARCS